MTDLGLLLQVSKSQLLADLEQRVKKYEKWSHVDVDKVMIELEKKEAELKQLQVTLLSTRCCFSC